MSPAQKLANTQTLAVPPLPLLKVPPLPAKLQKIDPDGCAKFQQDLQQAHDQWVQTANTLGFIQQGQVQVLIRKG